jgi:hypothetical protein
MSDWAYFTGFISTNSDVNLSKILQHAPVGSEGGLLLYNSNIPDKYLNRYVFDHGLRDVTHDANLKYKINFWFKHIKSFIIDLSLRVTFTAEDTIMFYSIDKQNNIFNYTIEKLK